MFVLRHIQSLCVQLEKSYRSKLVELGRATIVQFCCVPPPETYDQRRLQVTCPRTNIFKYKRQTATSRWGTSKIFILLRLPLRSFPGN